MVSIQHCREAHSGRTKVCTRFGDRQELEGSPNRRLHHLYKRLICSYFHAVWTGLDGKIGPTEGDDRVNVEMHSTGYFQLFSGMGTLPVARGPLKTGKGKI